MRALDIQHCLQRYAEVGGIVAVDETLRAAALRDDDGIGAS
ncbi:hypothetical protein WJ542_21385 [Paraburkholderia sp. B3]